jgi:putative phosphoesterase
MTAPTAVGAPVRRVGTIILPEPRRMKVGLISDTHSTGTEPLPPSIFAAFGDVDLILHAGDIYSPHALAQLARIAPVYAARGNGDAQFRRDLPRIEEDGYVVCQRHLLRLGRFTVGLIHAFPTPADEPYVDHAWLMDHHFGLQPDIIVCGDTHVESVVTYRSTTILNPGSPTLPHHIERLGTVAVLTIGDAGYSSEIIRLDGLNA